MTQYAEVTPHTRHGARGVILPPKTAFDHAHEDSLLPRTEEEILMLELSPEEAVFDGGFSTR